MGQSIGRTVTSPMTEIAAIATVVSAWRALTQSAFSARNWILLGAKVGLEQADLGFEQLLRAQLGLGEPARAAIGPARPA